MNNYAALRRADALYSNAALSKTLRHAIERGESKADKKKTPEKVPKDLFAYGADKTPTLSLVKRIFNSKTTGHLASTFSLAIITGSG